MAARKDTAYLMKFRMNKLITKVLVAFLTAGLFMCTASARASGHLNATEPVNLRAYETYFNALQSIKATFVQVDAQGNSHHGRFYLFRPGHMRIEYAKTAQGQETLPLLLVADGSRLIHYDKDLKETHLYSFDATPAGFFLRDTIAFSGDVKVLSARRHQQTTEIEITKAKSPDEGSLVLIFSENPRHLRKWIVRDPYGQETTVTLMDSVENVKLDPDLFDPNKSDPDQLIEPSSF